MVIILGQQYNVGEKPIVVFELHLKGVELTRFALFYCFCFSEGKTSSTGILVYV